MHFKGRALGFSAPRFPPPALPAGPPAPASPAPPPSPLPAPPKRGSRRLGPGKGPPRRDAARRVRPGGMSAHYCRGCSGPAEVRRRRGRAGGGCGRREGGRGMGVVCALWAGCGALERWAVPGSVSPAAPALRSPATVSRSFLGSSSSLSLTRLCRGRGGSGDTGIPQGRAAGRRGAGAALEAGGGRGRSILRCPSAHPAPGAWDPNLGASARSLGWEGDTCPLALSGLGLRCVRVFGQVAGERAVLISISCGFQMQTSRWNRDRLSSGFHSGFYVYSTFLKYLPCSPPQTIIFISPVFYIKNTLTFSGLNSSSQLLLVHKETSDTCIVDSGNRS